MAHKLKWMVVNVTRGWVDGHYLKRGMAEEAGRYWASEFPGEYIIVTQIGKSFGPTQIPDDVFMATARRRVS